jgi:hypothetical protein
MLIINWVQVAALSVGKQLGQQICLEISPPHWHVEQKGSACLRDVAECGGVPNMTRRNTKGNHFQERRARSETTTGLYEKESI